MSGLRRPPLRVWIWTAATLALAVVAALLWRGSDAAATSSTTAHPADVPSGAPAGAVSEVWSVDGDPLPADVVEDGRVLVGSAHGVRGLDPATGEDAWHYIRENAWLCGLTATDGVAVAVFRTEDRCDEAVGLDAGTGVRTWTRNVNFRADATLSSTSRIVLASSPTGVVTLDPTGNNIRWRWSPPSGCRVLDAAVGDAGVAVLQHCAGSGAVQLRLADGFDGDEHWTRDLVVGDPDDVVLLGAGRLVGVRAGDEARLFASADSTLLTTLPAGPDRAVRQTSVPAAVLVLADGRLTALDPVSGQRMWDAPATGLPGEPLPGPDDEGSVLPVPDGDAVVSRDAVTGAEVGSSTSGGLPADGSVTAIGPTLVLRLADRVVGYR
ncbi:outer membrane protein assembly factor BamB family protein [Blastococcus atacamensis]|uniref:outer membrane protein assembly factor BamB family protein n=1 Tax=Blastococcus atacamensis TaxID=2070508 RepID=UPI000CEBD955|nr:PQQ-binding-like beta-propeller repeat protein [Blastococcus atacamensis]